MPATRKESPPGPKSVPKAMVKPATHRTKPRPKPVPIPAGVPAWVPMPSRSLTPGETFAGVTAAQVCTSGWAGAHRDVSSSLRSEVYAEYGFVNTSGTYEVDHLISLELGGDNSIRNLWPEKNDHPQGAINTKDLLENRLHNLVCSGSMSLHAAQTLISTNWYAAYKKYGGAHYSGSTTHTTSAPHAAPTHRAPATHSSGAMYYPNCAAVRAAGAAPLSSGDPGYSRKLDRDGDGVACE